MNEAWKWRPERTEGIWRHGCAWAKPFTAAAVMLLQERGRIELTWL